MKAGARTWPSADELLRHLGIDKAADIELEEIAQYCGATILYEPLAGCEARLLGSGDEAYITVNTSSHPYRRRFSAGHELGHWMHDRHEIGFSCTERMLRRGRKGEDPERRANRYATELLMPPRLFMRDTEHHIPVWDSVTELARLYRTSLTATAIRLVELGPQPCILVYNEPRKNRWTWFRRSPQITHTPLWPRNRPGPESIAWKMLLGEPVRTRGEQPSFNFPWEIDLPARNWIKGGAEIWKYSVTEDSIEVGRGKVLTFIWFRDHDHQRDLEMGAFW